jgi:hypothetical protein
MNLTSLHPSYSVYLSDWVTMGDCYRGERIIKEKGVVYLPATPGQNADGMEVNQKGWTNYQAYKMRARFPDFVSQAVEALLGVMHRKPAVIELPKKMEPLLEKATVRGESLQMLLRRINTGQLVTGRLGLLADVPDGAPADVLPYIATYDAQGVLNWDDQDGGAMLMAVLDESGYVRKDTFDWELVKSARVLLMQDGVATMGVFTDNFDITAMVAPSIAGRTLERLPFVIVNSKDIVPDPDDPPLMGLARLALACYRGEADYRQTLFMQGQDTLVVIGGAGDDEIRAGAGAQISLGTGGDAKYIGVSGDGLEEMRLSIENDHAKAAEIGGQLLAASDGNAESGDALRIRVSARTSSLNQIALAGAGGLQAILRTMAEWVGANPEEVIVTPNLDFADDKLDGPTLVSFMTAKSLGAPLSKRSIHGLMRKRELTEMTYEEELAEIEQEEPEPTGGGDEVDGEDGEGTPAGDTEEQEEEQEKKADKTDRRTGKPAKD